MKKGALMLLIAASASIPLSSIAFADGEPELTPSEMTISGSAEAGGTMNTGNTHNTLSNSRVDLTMIDGSWKTRGFLTARTDIDHEDDDSNEYYEFFAQRQYNIDTKNYSYFNTNYVADSEDGYDHIWNSTVGYGRVLFHSNDDKAHIDWQLGPGYRFQPNDNEDASDQTITVNSLLDFIYQFNEHNKFTQSIRVSYATGDTILTSELAYASTIYKDLAVRFAFHLRHDSHVLDDSVATDTTTTVSLRYSF